MRILATAGRKLGRRSDSECSYLGLIAALRQGGAQVEEGFVAKGQDLSAYDRVLVEVPNPSLVSAVRFEGAMWALSGTTTPAVAIYDHWSMNRLHHSLDRAARATDADEVWLYNTIKKLLAHETYTAVNAFPWGHRRGFEWATWCYDPSMMMTYPTTYRGMDQRERKWVLATYEDHRAWLREEKLRWPIEEYGRASHGRQMSDLHDLMERYSSCWGAIIPPYHSLTGSGYWRNRLVHMAQVRSLFHQDWEDANVMGEPFLTWEEEFVKMQDDELQVIAEAQSKWFFDNVWSKEQFIDEAIAFMEGIA